MPFRLFAFLSNLTFGTYNDVTGNQTNTYNVQGINVYNQALNVHEAHLCELKKKLNPPEFSGNDRPDCLKGTRLQTLQSIDEWVNAEGYPNVLLLIGGAGTGKSTIATTVAGRYQRRSQLGCHIFFLRGSSDPGNVLESVAYSLAVYSQSIAESLVNQLKNKGNLGPSNLNTKFGILLQDSLSAVAADVGSPILIVLDALDECGTPETRQGLINALQHGLPSLPSNFRFLVTSRPEGDLLPFISLPPPRVHTLELDRKVEENKLDVYAYIKHELEILRSSPVFVIPQDWRWDEGVQSLADSADGLFIWASTAIKFISENKPGRFGRLKNLVENGDTLDLNELYATILKNAFKWDKEMEGTFESIPYPKFLWMPWYIDPDVQKAYIASKCLERMEDSLRYNICNIPSSFVFNIDVPDIENLVSRYIPPSLKYICCNWAHHLQSVPYSRELCYKLRSFTHNQLLFWFEVLSLTSTFNDHVGPALLFAIEWVGNNDPELSSFLRDAHLRASVYSEPISQSVLQIYTSLLPLTKEESPMSIHYSKYANDAFRVEYIGRKPRNDCIKTIQVGDGFTPINFLFFSPDGTRIISSSKQGVCVWDATSGELIAGPLSGNDEYRVFSAAYLPDGRYIIGVSRNGIIRNWDVLTSSLVWERVTFEEQTNSRWIVSVIFSPDRKSVVFGDDQGSIEIWDVETGKRGGQMLGRHFDYINCFSFSSDGKYLASGSDDTTILIWDMDKKEVRTGPLSGHTEEVTAVDFSPNGGTIISGSLDGNIYVWDVNLGQVLRKIICENVVYSVTYSPDGLFILAGGRRWMSMWNVVDAMAAPKVFNVVEYENVEYDEKELVWETSFSPDGSRFVTGCGKPNISDTIQIWDASRSLEETKAIFEEQRGIESIALSSGGKFIASGSNEGSICLWNALTGEFVKKIKPSCRVASLSFSPFNEQLIAFGSWGGTVKLWDVTNDVTVTIGNHESSITSIAFSPSNEKHVASGSEDATIFIWNIEHRELAVSPLTGHDGKVTSIAYSPDGTRLVSGSRDKTLGILRSILL
ncbi:nucleotide-binding-oligomerization-domain like receptor [Pyrrhoderma noxium]|uniref:Nucleotide-binding-oligomerization-domain like receptor n=1 Tax=Pyrrhoderma noxium TaxID=2282107 RepID=A0A286UPX8_9AGAM|nr:nucleotide-binding-oligomerization-domain like receptor [Pyrrhoderma noxium]